ncbi:MAG: FG-GAP repeat protein, partial [Victivallales bacterium]|nr:FG-GAP repeat protein [Victivallales bacterium]
MYFKKIEFPELESSIDTNTSNNGAQSIFIDFDKAGGAFYDKNSLSIHTNFNTNSTTTNNTKNSSNFSSEAQFQIHTDLNSASAGMGLKLNTRELAGGYYSTVSLGDSGSEISRYASSSASSETVTVSNEIKKKESFVFSKDSSQLLLPGLELADSDVVLRGTQTIFLDFDGASNVSYDNDALDIHINLSSINDSGLSDEVQFQIMTDLNNTFAGTGVNFSITSPSGGEYSTIYVGGDGTEFSRYGFFDGLSETIDIGSVIKDDNAFVFSDKFSSTSAMTETIAHEAAHLIGYQHTADDSSDEMSDFATVSSFAQGSRKFIATDGATYDTYGYAVAASGSHVVVGSFGDSDNGYDSGSAYAYRWDSQSSSYTEYKINDSVTGAEDNWFGFAVDSYGDSIIVGADWGDGVVEDSGAAYIYTWDSQSSSYSQETLSAFDGAEDDAYGDALAMSANVVVVGAYLDDNANGTDAGSAYIYRWDDVDSYDYETKLTASNGAAGGYYGYSVAVSGDHVAVGGFGLNSGGNPGNAYVYRW